MHKINLDLTLDEISKIQGSASLDLSIKNGQVDKCQFKITEYKRFYTQAIKGKAALAAPALLARICGTCSNAHILASIKAVEAALKITPSAQTRILRRLVINGLIIRDHALHLYVFVLPDLFNKDSLLDFDEHRPEEHQWLDDAFAVKEAGNRLSILTGGRSVHAPYPMVGGFLKFPESTAIQAIVAQLQQVRPAVIRLIRQLADWPISQTQSIPYLALKNPDYSYLNGRITGSDGLEASENHYRSLLEHKSLPYSHASAYTYKKGFYMTGALARINLNSAALHPETKKTAAAALGSFPSKNVYHNNLAQAIEVLNAVDDSLEVLQKNQFQPEPMIRPTINSGEGIGVIEAPRGILYHHLSIQNNVVTDAEILVPTGQNQLNIENDIKAFVETHLRGERSSHLGGVDKDRLSHDIEVLIRAYDPCMSCASHFLKINWK